MEFQFMDPVADFEALFTSVASGGVDGFNVSSPNASFPLKTKCKNDQLTELLVTHMESMEHDKLENIVNKTVKDLDDNDVLDADGNIKYMQEKDGTFITEDIEYLEAGQVVNMKCKDPILRPSADRYDLDSSDGLVTAVCQPDGNYSVRVTQLGPCVAVCDQTKIPIPGLDTGLVLHGILGHSAKRVKLVQDIEPTEFIWANDRLVYKCREKNYGIEGGADVTLDRYQCTNQTVYNAPIDGQPNTGTWPKCKPQTYMVIEGVERMLEKYDERIENRYKLIRYQEEDAQEHITLNNHVLNVTVPTVAVTVVLIIIALLCSRNDSPICSICASKHDP